MALTPLPTETGVGASKDASSAPSQFQHSRKPKGFNLNTYKLHSLGDYADTIRQYGTTDSYSTQLVSGALMLPWIGGWLMNTFLERSITPRSKSFLYAY